MDSSSTGSAYDWTLILSNAGTAIITALGVLGSAMLRRKPLSDFVDGRIRTILEEHRLSADEHRREKKDLQNSLDEALDEIDRLKSVARRSEERSHN